MYTTIKVTTDLRSDRTWLTCRFALPTGNVGGERRHVQVVVKIYRMCTATLEATADIVSDMHTYAHLKLNEIDWTLPFVPHFGGSPSLPLNGGNVHSHVSNNKRRGRKGGREREREREKDEGGREEGKLEQARPQTVLWPISPYPTNVYKWLLSLFWC